MSAQGFTYDPEVFAALRKTAERYVRNLNGSDRLASAAQTLAMLDEIERLRAERDALQTSLDGLVALAVESKS